MKCQKTVPLRVSEVTGKPATLRTSISRWTVRFATPSSLVSWASVRPKWPAKRWTSFHWRVS